MDETKLSSRRGKFVFFFLVGHHFKVDKFAFSKIVDSIFLDVFLALLVGLWDKMKCKKTTGTLDVEKKDEPADVTESILASLIWKTHNLFMSEFERGHIQKPPISNGNVKVRNSSGHSKGFHRIESTIPSQFGGDISSPHWFAF